MNVQRSKNLQLALRKQSGVVLVMTLIILLVVTLLGVSSVQLTGLLERMARNTTDSASALASAEAALIAAEAIVEAETDTTAYTTLGNTEKYALPAVDPRRWNDAGTWDDSSSAKADYNGITGNEKSRYIIEFIKTVNTIDDPLNLGNVGGTSSVIETEIFRITSRGIGRTDNAKVYLQSTYGKQF